MYKITCIKTGKIYIGKSINIRTRINSHKNVKKKLKGMYHFQFALLKYGWDSFIVDILETFKDFDKKRDKDLLYAREAYYIELFNSINPDIGYNICKYSTDMTGISCSEETKRKIGNSNRGRIHTEETREKLRQSKLGTKHSEETRLKMSDKHKGNTRRLGKLHSEETKKKMGKARLGRKHSEESKEKMRQSKLKNNNTTKLI